MNEAQTKSKANTERGAMVATRTILSRFSEILRRMRLSIDACVIRPGHPLYTLSSTMFLKLDGADLVKDTVHLYYSNTDQALTILMPM